MRDKTGSMQPIEPMKKLWWISFGAIMSEGVPLRTSVRKG